MDFQVIAIILAIGAGLFLFWKLKGLAANPAYDEAKRRHELFATFLKEKDGWTPEEIAGHVGAVVGQDTELKKLLVAQVSNLLHRESVPPPPSILQSDDWEEQIKLYRLKMSAEHGKEIERAFIDAYGRFFAALPAYIQEPGIFHAPLSKAIPNRKPIDELMHGLEHALVESFKKYLNNHYQAESSIKKFKAYDANSPFHFQVLLRDTDFNFLSTTPFPISIPNHLRFEGTWIVAPAGRGKTTLLSVMLNHDLNEVAHGKASVIVMDSKGDLIDHLKRAAAVSDGMLKDRFVLIEPHEGLALNPLQIGATAGHRIETLEYIFGSLLDTSPTELQKTLLRFVLFAMGEIPGSTIHTMRQFLQEGWKPYEEYVRRLPPDQASFFLQGEYDSKTYTETKTQLLWRIRDLTTKVPMLSEMFKAPQTKIDLGKEMDAGKLIVIDNSEKVLGDAGSEFFSRLFVGLILSAGFQRAGKPEGTKLPCFVYIDECQTVISNEEKIASILDRCRSQKIGLTLAHQRIAQIKSANVLDALSNCGVRMANSDDDAPALASRMRTDAEELRSLKKGQFALFMRDLTKSPLMIDVQNYPLSEWPKMTPNQFYELQQDMKARYGFTPNQKPESPDAPEYDTGPIKW